MTLLLIMGAALVLLAIVLASAAAGTTAGGHTATGVDRSVALVQALSNAPQAMTKEFDESFADRIMAPLQQRASKLAKRFSGADAPERIRRRLDVAGNPTGWTVERVQAGKVIGAVTLFLISLALTGVMGLGLTVRVVAVLVVTAIGWFGPNLYLYQKVYDRSKRMQRDLPDAIDLMTISVESGLAFDAAVQQVARNTEGPLADEFSRVLREMQIGQGRAQALRGLAERTEVDDVKSFVTSMVQADSFGIPIANVLRIQSQEIRTKRRQRAEEQAQKVPVKITVPLIFCILPTLFIAVMGPAVIHIMDNFSRK
ncbi:MAG TPA: type II secretion system F family protein [Nocardioides sp.]|jgi:tight adherence protein C|uniref:type II secretion system F family protein n=1 Tax=Nocardioides sp. TaxID=35761 RepID=UPI002E355259|nr:type II secretion system F family protein [Nocardioides sp.]HEX3930698.1 type II secretion system F family protein [Nocardioides sp.]